MVKMWYGWWNIVGDYTTTTQFYRDSNKPLYIRIPIKLSQDSMESNIFFVAQLQEKKNSIHRNNMINHSA